MIDRRSFLRRGSALVSGAVLSGSLLAGSAFPGSILLPSFLRRSDRGRGSLGGSLFFGEVDLDQFRSRYQTTDFDPLRDRILAADRAVERKFLRDEIRYNDQLYDISRTSKLAIDMAFHYLMTGDTDAADLAISCMAALPRFGRWDYFLEAGDKVFGLQRAPEATVATSLCWDWLEGYVDDSTRRGWLETMGEKGCEPSWLGLYGMRYPDRVVGWSMDETSTYFEHRPGDRVDLSNWPHILDRTNLKAVPASALAIGAVAYAREFGEDDRVKKWIEQAVFSLKTFRDLYAIDGSYDEGVSYANYTSSHIAQATVVLERYNGLSLYDEINWAGYVDYLCGMSMATSDNASTIVNFGDAGGAATASVPYWVALRTGDSKAKWYGDALSQGKDMWSLLWYPDRVSAAPASPGLSLWHSKLDWVVARTGYRPSDLVAAMRSGGPSNHEHADRNSIVVKWGGEVLIADPYRPPYSYADPAWMMRTTAGHSAVLIDGEGHQYHDGSEGTNASDASASIIRVGQRDGYVYWTSDASEAYKLVNEDVQSITRTVFVFGDLEVMLLVDKVVKMTEPSRIEARFFGDNRGGPSPAMNTGSGGDKQVNAASGGCKINVGGEPGRAAFVDIQRPLASVRIASLSGSGVVAEERRLPIPQEAAELNPFGSISTVDVSRGPIIVSAIVPYSGANPPQIELTEHESGYFDVHIAKGIGRVRCSVVDSGPVPDVIVQEIG